MNDWKRIFVVSQIYLPYTLISVVLSEVAVYNIFIYIRLIAEFKEHNYLSYLVYLIPPICFHITTTVFTPDPGSDTKTYFLERMRLFYFLFALLIASHFLYGLEETQHATIIRMVFILFLIIVSILKKAWLSYLVVFFWLFSFFVRGGIMVY